MAEYHVGCGPISGEIFAGTLSKNKDRWLNRSTVTDEAINAVRDHLVDMARREHREWYGYEWYLKDGRKVALSIKIEEGHKEGGEVND